MSDPELEPPQELSLHFAAVTPSGREPFPRSSIPCTVTDRRWSCQAPALALDLELRADGFVPIYRFGVDVPATGGLALGGLELRRGASLVVRVATEDGAPLGDGGRGRLVPFVPGSLQRDLAERLSPSVAEAPIGHHGFLQLAAVPTGTYALEVTHPGFAPTFEYPIELRQEQETRWRDAVVLKRPLDLEVEVSPPRDWRGQPWHLRLSRVSELTGADSDSLAFDGPVGDAGSLRIADQAAGRFTLQIFDSAGNPLHGELDRQVSGPNDAKISIALDLVVVRGEILYRDEPVQGTAWFGGRRGAIRSTMATSAEGEFLGVLSRTGWWTVDVEAPEIGVSRFRDRVLVEPDSRGEAEVVLELPDTELTGRVIDATGRPVENADALLHTPSGSLRLRSDRDGEFHFRAFAEGRVTLLARAQHEDTERVSNSLDVEVSEGLPAGPFDLVLEEVETFRGQVVSEHGPVVGAMVEVVSADPAIAAHSQARTDAEGRFEVRLRPQIKGLKVTVSPPGHALKGMQIPLRQPLQLSVPTTGGSLLLRLPEQDIHGSRSPAMVQVEQDGIALPPHLLWAWARGHGVAERPGTGVIEIPRLAPGFYRACQLTADPTGDGGPPSAACADGYLEATGTLELEIEPARRE